MKRKTLLYITTMIILFSGSIKSPAADIRYFFVGEGDLSSKNIIIEGDIKKGDSEKLIKAIENVNDYIDMVNIYTRGGDFIEAMKMGRVLRKLNLNASAPMITDSMGESLREELEAGVLTSPADCNCASAGFFILAGAIYRKGENIIVHRPYVDEQKLKEFNASVASKYADGLKKQSQDYMKEMGLPQTMVDYVYSIPGNNAELLPEELRNRYFHGLIAEYQDWYNSKCPDNSTECFKEITKGLQSEAYLKYFNHPYNQNSKIQAENNYLYLHHPFSLWLDAKSFLGKSFEEVKKLKLGSRYFYVNSFGHNSYGEKIFNPHETKEIVIQWSPEPEVLLTITDGIVSAVYLSYKDDKGNFPKELAGKIERQIEGSFGQGKATSRNLLILGETETKWLIDNNAIKVTLSINKEGAFIALIYDRQ